MVSLDTADIHMRGDTARLWIRYDLTRPAIFPDSTQARVFRMEILTDVDCRSAQAQDVTLRTYDSAGSLQAEHQMTVPGWQPLERSS
jgi:hypothetical protein